MSEHDSTPAAEPHDLDTEEDAAETLSPSVRRLIRQYDLDVTDVHGSGPHGRIRIGDVMAMIGDRAPVPESSVRRAVPPERTSAPAGDARDARGAPAPPQADHAQGRIPVTTIFECDMSRVLAHRKLMREQGRETVLTSYFALACSGALSLLGETGAGEPGGDLGIVLTGADGTALTAIVSAVRDRSFASLDAELAEVLCSGAAARLRARLEDADLVVHHHGASGSVLAFPLPLAAGRRPTLGIGSVRRAVAVKTVEGEESARITAQCYMSLTFLPEALGLAQASLFLNECVRTLEHWPVKPVS